MFSSMLKRGVAPIALVLMSIVAYAQTGGVEGTVRVNESGAKKPVPNAVLIFTAPTSRAIGPSRLIRTATLLCLVFHCKGLYLYRIGAKCRAHVFGRYPRKPDSGGGYRRGAG